MSYQLIHTSYQHLLDSSGSGYGTVARTENMPKALCTKLTAMSILREPKGGNCTLGPQFSYHIISMGEYVWHVLTCVQNAGADYSGRACHTAHHLVLTQQEVASLLNNELRPTPAGISLALLRSGFWVQKWQGEPRFIVGEPPMKPEYLPDATAQPTWKHLTGHKSNARAFYTPPYNRECLITIPAGIPSHEVLGLFHESDWLTHSLGWGCTYTTEAEDSDSFAETLRMVVGEKSPLVQRAVRTGHPVLRITAEMELAVEPEPHASQPQTPGIVAESGTTQQEQKIPARIIPRSINHYHYVEEPDWMLYDVAMPRSNPYLMPLAVFGSVALLTGISVGIWLGLTQPVQMLDDFINQSLLNSGDENAAPYARLEALLNAPYDHAATANLLQELMQIQETTQEDSLLLESAALLSRIPEEGVNHAAAIKRICECERLLQLPENSLGRLYLMEVTQAMTPDEWQERISYQTKEEWQKIKDEESGLFAFFSLAVLKDYTPGREIDQTPHTELATADVVQAGEQKKEEAAKAEPQVIGASAAVCGQELPDTLVQILNQLPLTVNGGMYSISSMKKGDSLQAARSLKLSNKGYHLYITPTEKEGEYLITPEHKEGRQAELPGVTITIRNNKLQKIRCKDGEAVVAFPIPGRGDTLTYVILAPRIAIPIPINRPFTFPNAEKLDFDISREDLSVATPSAESPAYQLKLKKKSKEFPWKISSSDIEHIQFSIALPAILERHPNRVIDSYDSSSFVWKKAKIVNEALHCEVEHRPNLPNRLEHVFEQVANMPCCGDDSVRNKELNLAHLFYISRKLSQTDSKKSQREKWCDEYITMLAHRRFNAELQKIMKNSPALLISADHARSGTGAAGKMRSELKNLLLNTPNAEYISLHICRVLSDSLKEAYKQEIHDFNEDKKKKQLLILKKLSMGDAGELQWHFHLQSGK